MTTKFLSCAETAKLVRKALKEAFPGIRFSVRSNNYAGGASIDVRWTDGPTARQVAPVAQSFQGGWFDGMTDYKGGVTHRTADGEELHFGADFVFCERDLSVEFLTRQAKLVAEQWGKPVPTVRTFGDRGRAYLEVSDRDLDREIMLKVQATSCGVVAQASPTAASFTVDRKF